jgi:hypothetical protein
MSFQGTTGNKIMLKLYPAIFKYITGISFELERIKEHTNIGFEKFMI